jgi:hypothetical protein
MEGQQEEEDPAIAIGFVAHATRLITRLGRFQGRVGDTGRIRTNLRAPVRLELLDVTDSDDDEDEDYMGHDEEDEDEDDEDEEDSSSYFDVSDSEESLATSSDEQLPPLDHVIAHSTAVRCLPSEGSARLGALKRGGGGTVNVMTMLKGREFNVSGNGRFSKAECCHVGARFLPTDGPSVVERLNSRAYIGQFSNDGTLFVAGFQVRVKL